MSGKHNIVAFVPARSGSKRVPGKNSRFFEGHPLIAYTITAALESGIFSRVVVSTDSEDISEISKYYGAEVPFLRPPEFSVDHSPDIEWLYYTIQMLSQDGQEIDFFSLLRPTSPFRQASTIIRAWEQFRNSDIGDSLRAVEKCGQHPGKMWVLKSDRMSPLLQDGPSDPPWHSTPYQALPEVYIQNASLEIAKCRVVTEDRSISGKVVLPFLTTGFEGFDINEIRDWWYAESICRSGEAVLPVISKPPFKK